MAKFTCQVNYSEDHTNLFMALAAHMDDKDLCLGPPIFHPETGYISQLAGMCPGNAGSQSLFVHLGDGKWHCSYDDGDNTATLFWYEISKWYTGDFPDG